MPARRYFRLSSPTKLLAAALGGCPGWRWTEERHGPRICSFVVVTGCGFLLSLHRERGSSRRLKSAGSMQQNTALTRINQNKLTKYTRLAQNFGFRKSACCQGTHRLEPATGDCRRPPANYRPRLVPACTSTIFDI